MAQGKYCCLWGRANSHKCSATLTLHYIANEPSWNTFTQWCVSDKWCRQKLLISKSVFTLQCWWALCLSQVPAPYIADRLVWCGAEWFLQGDGGCSWELLCTGVHIIKNGYRPVYTPALQYRSLHALAGVRKIDKPCPPHIIKTLSCVWKIPGSNTDFCMMWPFQFSLLC